MKAIPIHDAKTNLSKYIAAAKKGEKIYIGSFGSAEVVLTKVPDSLTSKKRDFSIAKGKIVDFGDAFTEDTEKEIADLMYGSDEIID
jgi:antitoxin (DNA-binding transcriptional repressor) of toxin-antitoxin stability system